MSYTVKVKYLRQSLRSDGTSSRPCTDRSEGSYGPFLYAERAEELIEVLAARRDVESVEVVKIYPSGQNDGDTPENP